MKQSNLYWGAIAGIVCTVAGILAGFSQDVWVLVFVITFFGFIIIFNQHDILKKLEEKE